MGLLDRFKKQDTAPVAAQPTQATPAPSASPAQGLDLGKTTGKLSLAKGSRVTIDKTPVITARCTWSSNTDYDLYALVLLKSGEVLTVSTFGSQAQPHATASVLGGAVKHLGDVTRGVKGLAEESIEIRMTDEIEAVFPIAYSAQSNGTGSFHKYGVSCGITNGAGAEVTIDSSNANKASNVYTLAIGAIRNTADGVQIEAIESYSSGNSENRPIVVNGAIIMDRGSQNLYK
jgi:tellurite resistance protein TerA